MKTKTLSNLALLLAAIIWGFAFVAQVEGTKYIGPFTMVGVRFFISIIALIPVILVFERGRVSREERKLTVIASLITGIVLFAAVSIQQFGIEMTSSAGVSGFITGLYIIFVPVSYFLFFRKKTGIQVWLGAICAAVGLFLLCYKPGEGFSVGLGELLLFICSLLWTVHVILIDHFGKKLRSLHYSWGQFAVCAALGIIFMFIFEGDRLSVDALVDAKWVLLYLGVLSSGCGYTLQVVGQKNADPTYAVIILSTESAFSAIGGAIFGIDNIPLIGYAGCVLMFGGIIFSQLEFPRRKTIGEKLVQIEETSENDET
jgi:drug/metabolite transporter (DMT)-like permease